MFRSAPVFATGLMCLGLSGCALALGGNAAPTTYDLIAPRSFAAMPKGVKYQLVVNEPTSVHALGTDGGLRWRFRPGFCGSSEASGR